LFKRKRLIIAVVFVSVLIFSFVNFIQPKYVIPIAMYHSINPNAQKDNRLVITPQAFARQMRFLKKHNYNVITLEKAADIIKNKKKAPANTIVLTFDDGYKDNYTYAFPILKKYGFPATLFIIIDEVGRPEGDMVSWDDIYAMQASGLVTIGSHTFRHPYLIDLTSREDIRREIQDSKKVLEIKLGRKVDAFCYPAGRFNKEIRQIVIDSGYKIAVATNPGKEIPDDDVFALKRLRISQNCANLFIFWIETSGYYNLIRENRKK